MQKLADGVWVATDSGQMIQHAAISNQTLKYIICKWPYLLLNHCQDHLTLHEAEKGDFYITHTRNFFANGTEQDTNDQLSLWFCPFRFL